MKKKDFSFSKQRTYPEKNNELHKKLKKKTSLFLNREA